VINRPNASFFVEGGASFGVGNWIFKKYDLRYAHDFPYYRSSSSYLSFFPFYIAPGIQIPFANHKFSLDIMLKTSFGSINSWEFTPSYRLNFHF